MKKIFLFIFFSYSIFYILLPPFQTPDEQAHYEVIYWTSYLTYPTLTFEPINHSEPGKSLQKPFSKIIQHTQIIPNFQSIKNDPIQKLQNYPFSERKQFTPLAIQSYNPPLYYIVGSFFLIFARAVHASLLTQFYLIRLASTVFYFASIFFAYKVFLLLFRKAQIANSLILFLGLNPLFMQSGIGISPDIASVFFVTLSIFLILRIKKLTTPTIVLLGFIAALAALSRAISFIIIPGFLAYFYYQIKDRKICITSSFLFLATFLLIQTPWFILNFIRYRTPIMALPTFGASISHGIFVSIPVAIFLTIWDLRHVFMHYSGFLGWNESFPFAPIFIAYTACFIIFSLTGFIISLTSKNKSNIFIVVITFFLFILFILLDIVRKVKSHQGWETGGRDALPIFLPLTIFTIQGITTINRKKIDTIAKFCGYFAIWYYYVILIFVLLPRYYV